MELKKILATISLAIGLTIGAGYIGYAQANEIDDMVEALNSELKQQDWGGFGEKAAEFGKSDFRYENSNFKKFQKNASQIVETLKAFGPYVSHAHIKTDTCGDRIMRVLYVFFAEEGQYFTSYWFFKVKDKWALNTFDMGGDQQGKDFIKRMAKNLIIGCD